MTWFAIRRISTDKLLPAPPVHQRGGQTHASFESAHFMPPRLFPTAKGANVAMKLWLRGDWTKTNYTYSPKNGRRKGVVAFIDPRMHLSHDLEVVEVEISLKTTVSKPSSLDLDD